MKEATCKLCDTKLEQCILPTAPISIGCDYQKVTSLEVLVCGRCGYWEPCSGYGRTPRETDEGASMTTNSESLFDDVTEMNKVQRYGPCLKTVDGEIHGTLGEEWNGLWIRASDYDALVEEKDALEEQILRLRADAIREQRLFATVVQRAKIAEARLDEALGQIEILQHALKRELERSPCPHCAELEAQVAEMEQAQIHEQDDSHKV